MQYSVPQFIDIEDKIVGPLTAKQTFYLMFGGGVLLLIFSFFQFTFFVVCLVIIAPITLVFTFYRPKGVTVSQFLSNFLKYYSSSHLYIWRRESEEKSYQPIKKKETTSEMEVKKVPKSKIRELAWVLDTSTSVSEQFEAKERPEEEIRR